MNRLKLLIVGGALALPLTSFGSEYPWLSFQLTDGTELTVAADNLAITYTDNSLQLKSATVDRSIAVDLIRSMQFKSEASGIDNVGADHATVPAVYYTPAGVEAGRFASVEEARKTLPSGLYIVNDNVKSFKIIF